MASTDEARLPRWANSITILALVIVAAQTFVAVHECGHAVAALALGGTIEEFRINLATGKPHVSYSGLDPSKRAIVTAGGPLLTLVLWLAWLLAARGQRGPWHTQLLFVGAVGALFPALAWSVFPLLDASGIRWRDDSVLFVKLTGFSPWAVALTSMGLLAGCALLLRRRVDVGATLRSQLPPIHSLRVHVALCTAIVVAFGIVAALSR